MIPSAFRSSLFLTNALKRSLPRQHGVMSKCFYTVESGNNDSDNTIEETKEEEKKNFWEIPAHPENDIEANRSVRSRSTKTAEETRDFKELLDTLFERKPSKPAPVELKPNHKDNDSIIEKKLLDLVMRNRQLYKDKAPLPRSMMAPIYGKSANRDKKERDDDDEEEEKEGREGVLDFLHSSDKSNWKIRDINQNKRIMGKEQELKAISTIVDTTNSVDLLKAVLKEINQEKYPKYYPRILAKAIEHASRKDPYLALTIFELAKSKSLESYILGCTTRVYDAMLLLRWEAWRDVYGMLNLVEEMTVNGITYSNDSRRIVRSVVQEIEAEGSNLDEEEEGESSIESKSKGIYWNSDEKRACNVMKEMVGKWIINK